MSRNGSGIYSLPTVYKAETGDLIVADQHNTPLEDIRDDLNAARPVVAGGTGATTASGARASLSVPSISDVQTGYVPRVATKAALSALDTASFKAAVLTETTREKLWMWKTGDFSTEEAGDTGHVNYIAADGVSTSLGCWVAATGDGVAVRPVSGGGTGANNAADARTNLGLGSAATSDTTDFATAAQGALADGAVQSTATDASTFSFVAGKDATPADTSKVLPTVERADAETVYKVADRTAMKALVGSKHLIVYLMEAGRAGIFKWSGSDLSTLVTADMQEGIYVAPSSDATGASGAWVRADFLAGKPVNPLWFGAALDGTADDYAAAQAAIDMISDTDGAEFIVPFGVMRISQSLNWGKLRATFNCIGRIMPHGSMNDFLVKFDFANVPGQIVNNNVAYRPNITRLDLDGEWKSRGVHFKQPYLSLFQRIYVARPYGTALEIDGGFECQFAGTALTLGKDREADWLAGAAAWDDATAYAVGDHIYIEYPAWAVGTTYAVSDYVTRNSRAYRCISGNVGNDPEVAGSADYWVHVGYEYYECLAANTDKSPPVGYTANNSVSANRYWKMVPAHEPLLKIDNSQESNMLIDNMHFTGLMIRDSDNRLAVWVDSNANDHMTININFHECQIHGMTPGMQAELESEYGETVLTDDGPDRCMVYLGRVARSSFVQCYVRPVSYDGGIGIQIGASDPLKITSGIGAELLEISGEGDRQVGIHVMTSIADPTTFFMGQISNFIVGTGARFLADPGQRLSGRVGTPQRFASGSTALPGIAWADDRTFGWLKSGTLMLLYQAAQQIMRAGMVSGTPYVDLPAKIHAGSLPGAADDTAAAAVGVEIGEFYRNGTSVQQRQT